MKSTSVIVLVACSLTIGQAFVIPSNKATLNKVFEYVGPLPLKEEKLGESNKTVPAITTIETTPEDLSDEESACWDLIVEQSCKY